MGVDALAKSPADGYTFGVVIAAFAANPTLQAKLPYDSRKDLTAVSLIGIAPLIAAVSNDLPVRNARELVTYAKANPGKISFGSSGSGAAAHLTTELFKSMTGVDMVHIPYKGAAPAMADLLGGRIQLLFDAASGIMPNGKVAVRHDSRGGVEQQLDAPTEQVRHRRRPLVGDVHHVHARHRLEELSEVRGGATTEEPKLIFPGFAFA